MKVRFTDTSRADLEAIGDWIAREDAMAAANLISELRAACEEIGQWPNLYPLARAIGPPGLRRRLYRPYLIFYRIEGGRVVIHAILHGARDLRRAFTLR